MFLHTVLKNSIGLFFPNLCIVCRDVLTNDKWLCERCTKTMSVNHARRDACPLCGQNRLLRACPCAAGRQFPFEAVYSIFDFDETIQAIVHEIKYRGQKRLALDTGKAYVNLVPPSFFEGMDTVVPVPLHFLRMMKRGYNQAEHLARGFVKGSAMPLENFQHVLVRKRPTKTQTRLSRSMRRQNVKGAFSVAPGKRNCIKNKNIILVDDIVTTGATTGECAKALIAAGCGKIRVLSLARD